MKKNTTAEKALLDAQKAAKAIKENTEKTLQDLVNNAITKLVMESEDEPEDEKDSYEVEDVKADEEPKAADDAPVADGEDAADEKFDDEPIKDEPSDDSEAGEGQAEDVPADDSEADKEWSDLDDFKVNDKDFDFTGVEGDDILKIFRQLGEGDKLVVVKEPDGSLRVEHSEEDANDVDGLDPAIDEPATADNDIDDFSIEDDFSDDEEPVEGSEEDVDFNVDDAAAEDAPESDETKIDINEDNLGYTDSYQKDVFAKKPNMAEPADSKTTYSMDAGAPEGAEKPWAGKHEEPDYEKVEECGDMAPAEPEANIEEDGSGLNTKHKMVKTQNRINKDAQNQKVVSQDGEYKGNLNESVKKIIAKAKEVQKINEQYSAAIKKLKNSLMESAVSNISLVNMVKLLSECTMTADERKNLMGRFKNVKSLKESKETYEAIKRELNESAAKAAPIIEKQIAAEPSKSINETVMYQKNSNPCLDLMDRMDNLFKA